MEDFDFTQGLVAVVYPVKGGYIARILPLGVVVFNEELEGLTENVTEVLEQYESDLFSAIISDEGSLPVSILEWDLAMDESDIFLMDNEEERTN